MRDYDIFNPVVPTVEEVEELETTMADLYNAASLVSVELYGKDTSTTRLRDEYKKDQSVLSEEDYPNTKRLMDQVIGMESRIISSFILAIKSLCDSFHLNSEKRPGVIYGDYLQTAVMGLYDAIYTYDGSNHFTTYIYSVVKNRLVNFVRNEQAAVHSEMRSGSLIAHPEYTDTNVEQRETCLMMKIAIAQAPLNTVERQVIEYFMAHGRGSLSEFATTHKSPATGNYYSKQRIGQIYLEACEKIRSQLEEIAPSLAAA